MRWLRRKKTEPRPEVKTAWAFVPAGNVGELAAAVARTLDSARFMGVDPKHVQIHSVKPRAGAGGWDFEFAIPAEPWRRRGIPIIPKADG